MSESAVLIISPHYPPFKSGLSDYTFKFEQELKKQRDVRVLSGDSENAWKGISLSKLFFSILMGDENVVLIQYVPYMYGKRGMNLQFPILIFLYSLFKRKRIQLMVHEYNYPYLGNLKSLVLNFYHRMMGKLLLWAADDVFCTTEHFKTLLTPMSFSPVEQLPVGSNISKMNKETGILKKLEVEKEKYVCLFGNFHSSKDLEFLVEELARTQEKVLHIGATVEDYKDHMERTFPNIVPTGFLAEDEVSEILKESKLLLCYFVDGATLRRGSLLAGIEHSTPILTNKSANTEKDLLNCKNITFAQDREHFKALLSELIHAPKRDFSEENPFSWKRIVTQYLLRRIG